MLATPRRDTSGPTTVPAVLSLGQLAETYDGLKVWCMDSPQLTPQTVVTDLCTRVHPCDSTGRSEQSLVWCLSSAMRDDVVRRILQLECGCIAVVGSAVRIDGSRLTQGLAPNCRP